MLGLPYSGPHGHGPGARLGADLRTPRPFPGDVRGSRTLSRDLQPGGELGGAGADDGPGEKLPNKRPNRSIKEVLGYPLTPRFRELLAEGKSLP